MFTSGGKFSVFTLSYVNTALNQSAFRIGKCYIIKSDQPSRNFLFYGPALGEEPGYEVDNSTQSPQNCRLSALKSWLQLILAKYDINGNYSSYIKATSTKLAIIIVRPSVNKLQHFVAMETVT